MYEQINGMVETIQQLEKENADLKLRLGAVSGSLPPDELEESLSKNKQYTIWHDGGEWLISVKGKEQEQCKTLREWLVGNDR